VIRGQIAAERRLLEDDVSALRADLRRALKPVVLIAGVVAVALLLRRLLRLVARFR
jgi:hypothetical protein